MSEKKSGLSSVPGFKFASVKAGIKYKDRYDYCLILADSPCNAAGVFTTNKVNAAPVKLCRERIDNKIKAILVNATNANACTGDTGMNNAKNLTSDIAEKLSINEESILMSSTGIIGHQLPLEKMLSFHDELKEELNTESGNLVAESIMTTDTVPKETSVKITTSKGEFTIAGTAKGSGMIAPNMATMLSFIITNAPVKKTDLDKIFKKAADLTFNSLTIDGDMSTNDSAIIMSPVSKQYLQGEDLTSFIEGLIEVMDKLAFMLVEDGEGVTKVVKIQVETARDENDAKKIAKSVSESLLVKTAIFGKDPNWGRIACAAGYSGAELDEDKLSIFIEDIQLLKNGSPCTYDENIMNEIMDKDYYEIKVEVGIGDSSAQYLTSDLSYDYVKINAEYST